MTFLDRMMAIDRRWIYLLVALAVIIPLIQPLGLPVMTTEPARNVFDYIENLERGSNVLIAIDFDPSSKPELFPMLLALFRHTLAKGHHLVAVTLWPAGAALGEDAMSTVVKEFNERYQNDRAQGDAYLMQKYGVIKPPGEEFLVKGQDFSYLGYKAGSALVVVGLGDSFTATFPNDYAGDPTAGQPIFRDHIGSLNDIDFMIDIAAGATVEMWIAYGKERYKFDMAAGCTAVSATQYYPFLQTNQILGLLGGLKGAAEYERMLLEADHWDQPGLATSGMDAQSVVHLMTIIIVIFTNALYLLNRRAAIKEDS